MKSKWTPFDVFGAFALIVLTALALNTMFPQVRAGDKQGAATLLNAQAEGYIASIETSTFVTLDGSDTVTGLEDPHIKFGNVRILRLHNPNSRSKGTKTNLKIQCKFSGAAATADIWVAYYWADPDELAPPTYHLTALEKFPAITATAAKDGALFLSLVQVDDSFAATHCVVFSDNVSAGTVAVWLGTY